MCLLLTVVALVAVAATAFADGQNYYGNPQQVEVIYDGQPTTVVVDGDYACQHPRQRGLQADAVVTRERVDNHEGRIVDLEHEPRVVVVAPQPAQPAPVPSGTPAGGPATNQPVVPAGGRTMIDPFWQFIIGLLFVGGVSYGLYAAFTSTATANEDNAERRRIRRQGLQTDADRDAMGIMMDALPDVTTASEDGAGERYSWSVRTRSGGSIRRSGRLQPRVVSATPTPPAAPGTPGAPAPTPNPAETAARAALTRAGRLNAIPAIAAGQAQALAAILVALGTDLTNNAACDAVAAANPGI
jgi:hypothetical protein